MAAETRAARQQIVEFILGFESEPDEGGGRGHLTVPKGQQLDSTHCLIALDLALCLLFQQLSLKSLRPPSQLIPPPR